MIPVGVNLVYLQFLILLLEVLILIRVTVRELVDLDPVLLDLFSDLHVRINAGVEKREEKGARFQYNAMKCDFLQVCYFNKTLTDLN